MIRVLFIVLAVVSIAVAFAMSISWMYLVAAGMLAAAAVILTIDTRKKLRRSAVAGSRPAAEPQPIMKPRDELKSLGIMEIRPKGAGASARKADATTGGARAGSTPSREHARQAVTEELADGAGPGDRTEVAVDAGLSGTSAPSRAGAAGEGSATVRAATEQRPRRSASPTALAESPPAATGNLFSATDTHSGVPKAGVVRKRARTARIMVEGVSEALRGEVVLSTLRALRAVVDATSVVLLRRGGSPPGYSVEAIVSRNAFARSGGRFPSAEPLTGPEADKAVSIRKCGGAGGLDPRRLGYYHETIAIREIAVATLKANGVEWLLVADSMNEDQLSGAEAGRMVREFGRLFQALVSEPAPISKGVSGRPLRPRREIIAEEMKNARTDSAPLALALVHLNRAESLPEERREEADEEFANRLRRASEGGRVERFGDMTYGILRQGDVEETTRWASTLHEGFADAASLFEGGVSLGVAMLGDRHDGPDELRADATAALRESYESGACIILE